MMTSLRYLDDVHIHYLFNQLILYYLYMKQKKDMLSMLSTQNRYKICRTLLLQVLLCLVSPGRVDVVLSLHGLGDGVGA